MRETDMKKKHPLRLVIILTLLFGLFNSTATIGNELFQTSSNMGMTLYVGGSGPGNYTNIQDAIDNANDGDTIFVYSGKYYENIVIHKAIELIGEDKQSTIIDGGSNWNYNVITINISGVSVSDFTLQHSGSNIGDSGILIVGGCNGNIISNNIIKDNSNGIYLKGSSENSIIDNVIANSIWGGIEINDDFFKEIDSTSNYICGNLISYSGNDGIHGFSDGNEIFENTIHNNERHGIMFGFSSDNHFYKNHIYMNGAYGISLHNDLFSPGWNSNNKIERNNISYNHYNGIYINGKGYNNQILENTIFENGGPGIEFVLIHSCTISSNNLIDNTPNAYFLNLWVSSWSSNYWSDWNGRIPYVINGHQFGIPWKCRDWNPADEPYEFS